MKIELELSEQAIKAAMKASKISREEAIRRYKDWLQAVLTYFPEIFSIMKATGKIDISKIVQYIKGQKLNDELKKGEKDEAAEG